MSDSALNEFVSQGTTTQRLAQTPTPPTPASGSPLGYFCWDHTLQQMFAYDTIAAAWVAVASVAGTGVTGTGLTSGAVIVGAGSSAIAADATLAKIKVATITVSDAAAKTLPTTPVLLIAAPGAGFRLVLHLATLRSALTGAYTNVDATCFSYLALGADDISNYIANDATTSPVLADATNLFHTNALSTVELVNFSQVTTPAVNDWGNAALVAANDYNNVAMNWVVTNGAAGNFTGGNAANSWKWHIYYSVETVP
jgi:hypothetical protein